MNKTDIKNLLAMETYVVCYIAEIRGYDQQELLSLFASNAKTDVVAMLFNQEGH